MKINWSANLPLYQKYTGKADARSFAAELERAGKTDVAEFSHGQSAVADRDIASMKAGLVQDTAAATSTARLVELRQQIREGTYRPKTEDLVNAILGGHE